MSQHRHTTKRPRARLWQALSCLRGGRQPDAEPQPSPPSAAASPEPREHTSWPSKTQSGSNTAQAAAESPSTVSSNQLSIVSVRSSGVPEPVAEEEEEGSLGRMRWEHQMGTPAACTPSHQARVASAGPFATLSTGSNYDQPFGRASSSLPFAATAGNASLHHPGQQQLLAFGSPPAAGGGHLLTRHLSANLNSSSYNGTACSRSFLHKPLHSPVGSPRPSAVNPGRPQGYQYTECSEASVHNSRQGLAQGNYQEPPTPSLRMAGSSSRHQQALHLSSALLSGNSAGEQASVGGPAAVGLVPFAMPPTLHAVLAADGSLADALAATVSPSKRVATASCAAMIAAAAGAGSGAHNGTSGANALLNTGNSLMKQIPEQSEYAGLTNNDDTPTAADATTCDDLDESMLNWSSSGSLCSSTRHVRALNGQRRSGAGTPLAPIMAPLLTPAVTRLMASTHDMLHVAMHLPARMRRATPWKLGDYQLVRKLYKGYSSSVYKAICTHSEVPVVLKVYSTQVLTDFLKHQVYREVEIHSRLNHRNIIQLYGAFRQEGYLVMVQEYARGGDLHRIVKRLGGRLPERQVAETVMQPLMSALAYVHSLGIVHRDIKPENLLFTENWELRLADFGVSVDSRGERPVTRTGTSVYMAPEVQRCPLKRLPKDNKERRDLAYTPAVDVWSAGVMAYELLVGMPPNLAQLTKAAESALAAAAAATAAAEQSSSSNSALGGSLDLRSRFGHQDLAISRGGCSASSQRLYAFGGSGGGGALMGQSPVSQGHGQLSAHVAASHATPHDSPFASSTGGAAAAAALERLSHPQEQLAYPSNVSPAARDFIGQALMPMPADRPTTLALMAHPLLGGLRKACSSACLPEMATGGVRVGSPAASQRKGPTAASVGAGSIRV